MLTNTSQTTLLKEYIKTLIATEVVFPGLLPRQWGKEFSKAELQAIYLGLKFVINTANPQIRKALILEFMSVDESTLHWFLCNFWRDIVDMMKEEPILSDHYKFVSN